MKKLSSRKGETLAEVLVGILITAVSTSLFLGMVSVASHINLKAMEADRRFYRAMSLLECFETEEEAVESRTGSLSVEGGGVSETFQVEIFYGDDMMSYQLDKGAGK